MDDLAMLTNADSITKEDFLECYGYAKKEALIVRNGRAGWRVTGLWPVNFSKVLIYPLVIIFNYRIFIRNH